MSFKVNNGHSFLHPVSGLFIGPGDFFEAQDPLPQAAEALTVEEFTDLKAPEQKEKLQELGIEPGSNEGQRIQQYTEWLQGQAFSDPNLDPNGSTDPNDNPGIDKETTPDGANSVDNGAPTGDR
jgi:hypothetical protein